jgi:hypothetical protein
MAALQDEEMSFLCQKLNPYCSVFLPIPSLTDRDQLLDEHSVEEFYH